jgi:hypothetical protein
MSQYASTITTNSNVPVAAVPLSGVVPAPVIGHQEYPAFTNPDKSAPSWTNTPKTS